MLIDLNQKGIVADKIRNWIQGYLGVPSLEDYDIVFTNGADAAIHAITHSILVGKNIDCFDLNYSYASRMLAEIDSHISLHETNWNHETGVRTHNNSSLTSEVTYITNPDNRLGTVFESIPGTERGDRIVVIDESYRDFGNDTLNVKLDGRTLYIRTFSKFFCLEDQRIAYILGPTHLIQQVRRMIPQYAIATPSIKELEKVLNVSSQEFITKKKTEISLWKNWLYTLLDTNMLSYAYSHTDFVTLLNATPEEVAKLMLNDVEIKTFTLGNNSCTRLRHATH